MVGQWTTALHGQSVCLQCVRKISTKPGENCQETRHLITYQKNATRTNRRRGDVWKEALIWYSDSNPPKCVVCSFNDIRALQLDHIKGNGAVFRREHPHLVSKSLALWLRKCNWPEGYRVLCANCQQIERERLGCNGAKK